MGFIIVVVWGGAVVSKDVVLFCRELEEYKEKQDDNQNGGDTAKIASKHVGSEQTEQI